jgi:hypothetical protein
MTTTRQIQPTRQRLEAEQRQLVKKRDALHSKLHPINAKIGTISRQLYEMEKREQIATLVGVPNGVKVSRRGKYQGKWAWMDDALGTLESIRRTRATVDYSGRKVSVGVDDIIAADATQGFTLRLGGVS